MRDFNRRSDEETKTLGLFAGELAVLAACDAPPSKFAALTGIRRAFTGELHTRAYHRDDLINVAHVLEPMLSALLQPTGQEAVGKMLDELIEWNVLRVRADGLIEVNY